MKTALFVPLLAVGIGFTFLFACFAIVVAVAIRNAPRDRAAWALLVVLLGLLALSIATAASAQDWPPPAATPSTDVPCVGCLNGKDALKTIGYPPTLRFVGRFVDSEATHEIQFNFRTVRARGVVFSDNPDPAKSRIYMMLGSAPAAYNTDTFLSRIAAHEGLQVATAIPTRPSNRRDGANGPLNELFLYWDRFFYAESGGGWQLGGGDGQDRLYGIDADDRGNVYLAYSTYGWGIVKDDFGTGGDWMPSIYQHVGEANDVTPFSIVLVKVDADYFVVVTSGSDKAQVWNATNVAAPVKIADLPGRAFQSFAKDAAGNRIATTDGNGRLQILTTSAFVNGGAPLFSKTLSGGQYKAVTTDGTNFYALSSIAGVATVSVINGSTFAETDIPIIATNGSQASFSTPGGIRAGGGFLAVWGTENAAGGWNIHLYKIGSGGSLTDVTLNDYFAKYYSGGAPAGYAHPQFSSLSTGLFVNCMEVAPYKRNGKAYLFVESFGLGDVYEIKAGDSLTAKVSNSAPVYGDSLTFSASSSSGAPVNVRWDFGDGTSVTSSAPVSHQYGGAATTNLPLVRHVTATSQADASLSDSLTVTLVSPKAASVAVAALNTDAFGLIVTGDSLADHSPGATEGHYPTWTIDQSASKHLPSDLMSVGTCSNHALSFIAHYGPYDPSTFTGNADASFSLGPIAYSARPFAFSIQGPTPSGDSAAFSASVRATQLAADLPNGLATGCAFEWDLIDANGVIRSPLKGSATLGSIPAFLVPRSQFNALGMRVTLHVSVASNAVSSACSSAGLATETVTGGALNGPDPTIVVTGCAHVGEPCRLSVTSSGSQDGWTYDWNTSGPAQCIHCGVGDSLSPSFTASGAYTATLAVANAVGATTVQSAPIQVGAPPCSPPQESNTAVGFAGATSGCFSATDSCSAGEAITFRVSTFGWSITDCISYLWDFGDGTQSRDPQPAHSYATNGQRNVSLSLTGGGVTAHVNTGITIGKGQPPPPPPPPPKCPTMFPDANVYIRWTGTASQCFSADTACTAGETINFLSATLGYDFSCAPHTFAWDFGDGAKSTDPNPAHVFAKDGAYHVTLHVSNAGQSVDLVASVKVGSGVAIPARHRPAKH